MGTNARHGALAGLITGVVFGVILQLISVRTPAGSRVLLMEVLNQTNGTGSLLVSWVFHLFDSVIMGAIFGAVMGARTRNYRDGFKYGALCSLAWWFLGGIFLMPIFLGMSIFSPQALEPIQPVAFQSLVGHVLFGLIFGAVFVGLRTKARKAELREARRDETQTRLKAG